MATKPSLTVPKFPIKTTIFEVVFIVATVTIALFVTRGSYLFFDSKMVHRATSDDLYGWLIGPLVGFIREYYWAIVPVTFIAFVAVGFCIASAIASHKEARRITYY